MTEGSRFRFNMPSRMTTYVRMSNSVSMPLRVTAGDPPCSSCDVGLYGVVPFVHAAILNGGQPAVTAALKLDAAMGATYLVRVFPLIYTPQPLVCIQSHYV